MVTGAPRLIASLMRDRPPAAEGEASLEARLRALAGPGALVRSEEGRTLRCLACGHRCLLKPGRVGICKVRWNEDGTLMVPRGYVAALQSDPIEKKPFFHVLPGEDCLTFGMLGCDFHCGYCQNWLTSQALRDPAAGVSPMPMDADGLVALAVRRGARAIGSSYNEPLITAEWAVEVFARAREQRLVTAFISNGNATPEVLDYLRPWTDCYKIDFKAMREAAYRRLGGVLAHVLEALRMVYERGFWLEVVTLVIPGFNDDPADLARMAETLAAISPDIPWHLTAFHQDYRMTEPRETTARDLVTACEVGRAAGLRYVYAGNLPGLVGPWEHTWCPTCGGLLVERYGYRIDRFRLANGACPDCGTRIPGIWS